MPIPGSSQSDPSFLDGLDAVPWAELNHAYGPAEDVPAMLRTLFTGSQEAAAEAEQELWSSINHQGSVYPATPAAVSFLAKAAAAGVQRESALSLLAGIAQSNDERDGLPAGAARSAVAEQAALLDPMLDHEEPVVRGVALVVLVECGALSAARVEKRWEVEAETGLRASLLHALDRVDCDRAAQLADRVLESTGPGSDSVATVALRLLIRAGAARTAQLAELGQRCCTVDVEGLQWWMWGSTPLALLFDTVAEHWGVECAVRLRRYQTAWAGPDARRVNMNGVHGVEKLADQYRSAAGPVVEVLTDLLEHPQLYGPALHAMRGLGPAHTRRAADRLARIAENAPEPQADPALRLLVEQEDPRAPRLLAASLPDRPQALAAAYDLIYRPVPAALAFDAHLLAAIRARISDLLDEPSRERRDLFDSTRRHNEPVQLVGLLRAWGPSAAPALPELLRSLDRGRCAAAAALAEVGLASPEVLYALRHNAATGPACCRLAAAQALESLNGEQEPLVAAIEYTVGQDRAWPYRTLDSIDRLDAYAERLLPALEVAYLRLQDRDRPLARYQDRTAVLAARARLGVAPDETVARFVTEITEAAAAVSFGGKRRYLEALMKTVPVLGNAAHDLIATLTALFDHPSLGTEALSAALAIDPGVAADPQLRARHVAGLLERLTGGYAEFRAIGELAELGVENLEPSAVDQLRALVDQDRRAVRYGMADTLITADERWTAELRGILAAQRISPE